MRVEQVHDEDDDDKDDGPSKGGANEDSTHPGKSDAKGSQSRAPNHTDTCNLDGDTASKDEGNSEGGDRGQAPPRTKLNDHERDVLRTSGVALDEAWGANWLGHETRTTHTKYEARLHTLHNGAIYDLCQYTDVFFRALQYSVLGRPIIYTDLMGLIDRQTKLCDVPFSNSDEDSQPGITYKRMQEFIRTFTTDNATHLRDFAHAGPGASLDFRILCKSAAALHAILGKNEDHVTHLFKDVRNLCREALDEELHHQACAPPLTCNAIALLVH